MVPTQPNRSARATRSPPLKTRRSAWLDSAIETTPPPTPCQRVDVTTAGVPCSSSTQSPIRTSAAGISSVLMVTAYTGPPTLAPSQVFWGWIHHRFAHTWTFPSPVPMVLLGVDDQARPSPLRPDQDSSMQPAWAPPTTGPFIMAPGPVGTASSVGRYPALPRYPPRCGDTVGSRAPAR